MPVDIGRAGNRRRVAFGQSDTDVDAKLIEQYEQHGVEGFDTDSLGVSVVVKRRKLLAHAIEDYGDVGALSEALGLRTDFVIRCAWYFNLDDDDLVREPPNEYLRPATPPWKGRPHPSEIGSGGDRARSPW